MMITECGAPEEKKKFVEAVLKSGRSVDEISDLWSDLRVGFFYLTTWQICFLLKKHAFPYCEQCVKCDRISSMKFKRRVEGPDHNILAGKRQKGGMRSQAFQIATYVNKIFAGKQNWKE